MAFMRIFWNYVTANQSVNLSAMSRTATGAVKTKNVPPGCVGVLFRSVLSEEADFSQFLSEMTLEKFRKARNEPDNTLLYRPKRQEEKSIGTLRIVRPDRFAQVTGEIAQGYGRIRVPIEYDQRFARFQVLLESTEFILEDVQEQMAERYQLQETFGDFNIFFFGKRAEVFTYSGTLFNACDNLQWRNKFLDDYENLLRGTKCAEKRARAYLLYDDVVREGFILSAGTSQNSTVEGAVKFTFTLLVTGKRILGTVPRIRTGVVSLDAKPLDAKNGITDFRFFRGLDPELPMVYARPIAGDSTASTSAAPALVVNDALPGDEPLSDLKQAMISRSLDALDKARGSAGLASEAGTLDHDILIDFIDRREFPQTSKLVVSGSKAADFDNLKGNELVVLLTAEPPLSVDTLTLKQAADAARAFGTEHKAEIGDELAAKLAEIGEFFAANGKKRLSAKVPQSGTTPPPTTNFRKLKEGGQYVLVQSVDGEPLTSAITSTDPIRTFDNGATVSALVEKLPISALDIFQRDVGISSLTLTAAAFCLIRNPQGQLFDATLMAFPEVASIGSAGVPDAIAFVRKQKLSALVTFSQAMGPEFESAMESAASGLEQSTIITSINTAVSIPKENIHLTEDLLYLIKVNDSSPHLPGFVNATVNYLFDMINEAETFNTGGRVLVGITTDTTAGILTPATRAEQFGATYFTKAYADSLLLTKDPATELEYILVDAEVVKQNGVTYLLTDGPRGLGHYQVYNFFEQRFNYSQLIADIGPAQDGPLTSVQNSYLHQAGYVKVPPANVQVQDVTLQLTVGYLGAKRKTSAANSPDVKVVTPGNVSADRFTTGGKTYTTAVDIDHTPPARTWFGTGPHLELFASIGRLRSDKGKLRGLATSVSLALRVTESEVSDLATGKKLLPSEPQSLARVKSSLDLANFTDVAQIPPLTAALKAAGITVANYFDLVTAMEIEKPMADNLPKLRQLILDAVAASKSNPAGGEVAKNDAANKKSICRQA